MKAQRVASSPGLASSASAASHASAGSASTLSPEVQQWELQYEDLQFESVIGKGSYGTVYRAIWHELPVAVKVLLSAGVASYGGRRGEGAGRGGPPVHALEKVEVSLCPRWGTPPADAAAPCPASPVRRYHPAEEFRDEHFLLPPEVLKELQDEVGGHRFPAAATQRSLPPCPLPCQPTQRPSLCLSMCLPPAIACHAGTRHGGDEAPQHRVAAGRVARAAPARHRVLRARLPVSPSCASVAPLLGLQSRSFPCAQLGLFFMRLSSDAGTT